MRTLALFLFACVLTPAHAQEKFHFPKDGNELLDYCGVVVALADSPTSLDSLSGDKSAEKMQQFNWCAGYLEATHDVLLQNDVNLTVIAMTGVTLAGPDKAREYAFDTLRVACIPDQAPILQLARVLVKWLREHPERLHELKSILTTAAFRDAFPCQHPTPKEAAKPTTVKP
jgi:hypothetical protein